VKSSQDRGGPRPHPRWWRGPERKDRSLKTDGEALGEDSTPPLVLDTPQVQAYLPYFEEKGPLKILYLARFHYTEREEDVDTCIRGFAAARRGSASAASTRSWPATRTMSSPTGRACDPQHADPSLAHSGVSTTSTATGRCA
jgi:hypothetical protein